MSTSAKSLCLCCRPAIIQSISVSASDVASTNADFLVDSGQQLPSQIDFDANISWLDREDLLDPDACTTAVPGCSLLATGLTILPPQHPQAVAVAECLTSITGSPFLACLRHDLMPLTVWCEELARHCDLWFGTRRSPGWHWEMQLPLLVGWPCVMQRSDNTINLVLIIRNFLLCRRFCREHILGWQGACCQPAAQQQCRCTCTGRMPSICLNVDLCTGQVRT